MTERRASGQPGSTPVPESTPGTGRSQLRPVVEREIGGQLHRRAGAVGQEVRDVVALERGVVLDALVEQEAQGVAGERVGRSAEPARPATRGFHDGVDPALEGDALVVLRELVELFVHVAVVAELVPRGQDGVDRLRVRLDAPARHEERLPDWYRARRSSRRGTATWAS